MHANKSLTYEHSCAHCALCAGQVAQLTNLQRLKLHNFDGIPDHVDLNSLKDSLTVGKHLSLQLLSLPCVLLYDGNPWTLSTPQNPRGELNGDVRLCAQVLEFQHSGMEALPPWIAAFSSLRILEMYWCGVGKWCLPALTGLQCLSITYCNLHEVSQPESKLLLTHFDLQYNDREDDAV